MKRCARKAQLISKTLITNTLLDSLQVYKSQVKNRASVQRSIVTRATVTNDVYVDDFLGRSLSKYPLRHGATARLRGSLPPIGASAETSRPCLSYINGKHILL